MKNHKQKRAASRAHVWLRCAASEEAQATGKNRFSPRSPIADEGTLIHARAARTLGADIPETSAEFQLFANPESDAQAVVDFYVGVVTRSMTKDTAKFIETDFTTETSESVYAVIPDAVLFDKVENRLTIFDLKTGFASVGAEDNEQLILGAHAVCKELGMTPATITGVIVQPRMAQIEYADIQFDPDFFRRLDAEMKRRAGRYTPGAHCKNCSLLTVCKAFRETLDLYLDPSIKDGLTSRPDEWARTLAISGPAKKFFDEIEKEAKEFLELGGTIPGFALSRSGGKRAWFREVEPAFIAEKIGLPAKELYEAPRLVTVAAAEKKISKDRREALNALAYQPMHKTLAVVDNKSFLAREGEKIIRVNTGLNLDVKTKVNKGSKQDGKKARNKK